MKTLPLDIMPSAEPAEKPKIVQHILYTLITLGFLLVSTGIVQVLFRMGFEEAELILVHTLFVVIISRLTPGYLYGIVAAIASVWAYVFFAIPPPFTFQFSYKFTITVFLMLLVTLVTSVITARMKTQASLAIQREKRAELLFEINQELLATRSIDTIVQVTNCYLISHLQRSVVFYVGNPRDKDTESWFTPSPEDASLQDFDNRQELRLAGSAFTSREITGYTTINPMGSQMIYIPIVYGGRALAVLGISCRYKDLSEEDTSFLQLLTNQVALALELERLSHERITARTEAEKEKMRSSLLRAISHDLRTPLTSILGASSTLLESDNIDAATSTELLTNINEGSQWLIRMVENLLSVTHLTGDTVALDKSSEAAEEVIGQAVSIIRGRFPEASIHVKVPNQLLMVPMDATLISQVLINLLENAVKNSSPDDLILVNLKKDEGTALFEVSDNGSGISDELLGGLFEVHYPDNQRSADASQGMGIGLSICDTIVRAHGGEIDGRNKETGGAIFSFTLPLEEATYAS